MQNGKYIVQYNLIGIVENPELEKIGRAHV